MNKIQNQKTNQNKNKNQISRQRTSWGVKICLVIAAHVRKTTETKIGKHILRSIRVHMDMAKTPKP